MRTNAAEPERERSSNNPGGKTVVYLEETLNLSPACPETLDTFVEFAQEQLVPACQRLGPRLMVAWYSNVEMFSQVTQVFEFDSLGAFEAFRTKSRHDRAWGGV